MKIISKIFSILCVCATLVAGGVSPAIAKEKRFRAKIGILVKSGEKVMQARSKDRLKAGDLIRIYVHPEESSHIYVVHTDHMTVTLLNGVAQKIRSATLVLIGNWG